MMNIPDPDGTVPVPEKDIDNRTNEEITNQLKTYCAPTESNKNVWAYWHSGFDAMPAWTQRNVIGWVRKLGPSWTIRVVDSIPGSATNVTRFAGPDLFPAAFNDGTMSGPFAAIASSDFVRLALLQLHGGVWMDAGITLIRDLSDIWTMLEDPSTPYELAGMTLALRLDGDDTFVNSFLAATRGNEFIKRWHQIFVAVWKNSKESTGVHRHPLLRHLQPFVPPGGESRAPDYPMTAEDMSDYLSHMLCGERLRDLVDVSGNFDGRSYYETKVYLLPVLREMHYFQIMTGWEGAESFKMLCARYDIPDEDRDGTFYRAKDMVHEMLRNTSMIKLPHGPKGVTKPWLADLWNQPTNCNADSEPGTFGAYLRNRALHLNQTRQLKPIGVRLLTAKVWEAGLLEPCQGPEFSKSPT
ncbi:putative capsule polysaccharide biosynthesis protein [Xylariales sp. AK1849]|nr:putative capsule polysaccharide biosynthesis protein [Xylariales sp. AK1849]